MANADRPRGAKPTNREARIGKYVAGGAIRPGEFVKLDSDGEVVVAAASEALLGVAASKASAQGDEVQVYDNPEQEFVVQCDDASIASQSAFNLNYDIVATAADATYDMARMELDGDTGATTATLPLKAVRLDDRIDNDLGDKADVIVVINNHQRKGGTGTAGV